MRVIVVDEESMEPITVIELGLAELRGWERAGRLECVRVAVPVEGLDFNLASRQDEEPVMKVPVPDIVELRIVRRGDLWAASTRQGEKALRLKPALLPGQRRAIALTPWAVS